MLLPVWNAVLDDENYLTFEDGAFTVHTGTCLARGQYDFARYCGQPIRFFSNGTENLSQVTLIEASACKTAACPPILYYISLQSYETICYRRDMAVPSLANRFMEKG